MKVLTPEISWHNREAILSVHFQKISDGYKIATGGIEKDIKIWRIKFNSNGDVEIQFLSNLQRHQTTVNVLRFSPNGEFLASGDSEGIVNVWKQSLSAAPDIFSSNFNSQNEENTENWLVQKRFRDHRSDSDVCDLCWSPDSKFLLSCSTDSSLVVWDVFSGNRRILIKENEKRFSVGVSWDPKSSYFISMSNDRIMNVYSAEKYHKISAVTSSELPSVVDSSKKLNFKLFHDSSLMSYVRRPCFTPDGLLLIVPAGCIEEEKKTYFFTYIFSRNNLKKPVLMLPSPKEATIAVSCCPVLFKRRNCENSLFLAPYRCIFAVLTKKSVIIYDTQQNRPIFYVSNIHYCSLTDCAWSNDGKILLVSSEDGYCTFISFDPEELGDLHQDPLKNSDDKSPTANQNGFATAKKQIQTENKPNLIISEPESLKNDKIAQNSHAKNPRRISFVTLNPVSAANPNPTAVNDVGVKNTETTKPRRVSFVTLTSTPSGEDIGEKAIIQPLSSVLP